MPLIQTDSQHYSDIADAIRDMSGNEETFYPSEMAAGVRSIPQTIAIQPIIYSLEEREVGVWTDGKPLYQRSIQINNPSWVLEQGNHYFFTYSLASLISNVENIYGFGYEKRQTGTIVPLHYNRSDSGDFTSFVIRPQLNDIYFVSKGNSTIYIFITLQYTKTTDTPGSGTWTPSGVPAHHYSTTEQVIGTWIDGKPLYEKTIVDNMTHSGGSINISHNISNIDEVTNISGVYSFGANNTWYYPISFADDPSTGNTNSVFKFCGINRSTNTILMYAGSNYGGTVSITKIRITLQYTKTTD